MFFTRCSTCSEMFKDPDGAEAFCPLCLVKMRERVAAIEQRNERIARGDLNLAAEAAPEEFARLLEARRRTHRGI